MLEDEIDAGVNLDEPAHGFVVNGWAFATLGHLQRFILVDLKVIEEEPGYLVVRAEVEGLEFAFEGVLVGGADGGGDLGFEVSALNVDAGFQGTEEGNIHPNAVTMKTAHEW